MRVYIETTIPSFYHNTRPEPRMQARQEWTRAWWDYHAREHELVTSAVVLEELRRGEYPNRQDCLDLLAEVRRLAPPPELNEIVAFYVKHRLMPRAPLGDATHLAFASWHECDVLLTWNCQHLANAYKFHHMRVVNSLLELPVPMVVIPMELLGEDEL